MAWVDINTIDNSTPFKKVRWKSYIEISSGDAWFSEAPNLVTNGMPWLSGNTAALGFYGGHRFNSNHYTCGFNCEEWGIDTQLAPNTYRLHCKDADRSASGWYDNTVEIDGETYYEVDFSQWQYATGKSLYFPYSASPIPNGSIYVDVETFSVEPTEINFSKYGDEQEITVDSETNWTASTTDSWFTFTPTAGTSADTTVTVAAPANHTALRTGTLSFEDGDNNTAVVNITQSNIVSEMLLDNLRNGSSYVNKMYIGSTYVYKRFGLNNIILNIQDGVDISSDGETISVSVSSNASWTAATTDAWITITNPTGSGDGSFSVTAAATESGRAGNITVTAEKGGFTTVKTIEVTQTVIPIPPDNQIWYWTKDNNPVTPDSRFNPAGVTIVSNVYDATKRCCVMTFSGTLTSSDYGPFNDQASGTNGIIAIAIPNSFTRQRIAAAVEDLETVIIGSGCTYIYDGGLQSNISMKEIYCYATTAPTLHNNAFVYFVSRHPAENGVLHIPQGCTASYSDWMGNTQYRLGYYHWTVVDDLPNPNL